MFDDYSTNMWCVLHQINDENSQFVELLPQWFQEAEGKTRRLGLDSSMLGTMVK